MKKRLRGVDSVIGLFLICVFVTVMLLTLASGAGAYKRIVRSLEAQYTVRTALNYISAKIRQSDAGGGADVGELGGVSALLLREELGGEKYVTYIYCHDGYIMELFCGEDALFSPYDGLRVIAADSLSCVFKDGLLYVECISGEQSGAEYVYLNSWEGGEK